MFASDQTKTTVEVDYIEVDMPVEARSRCSACDDARARLGRAMASASDAFEQLGLDVVVRDIRVRTTREAELMRVRGSPTIRIGAADIFPEHCEGEARIWHWRGQEYAAPPVALLTQALLKVAADRELVPLGSYEVPSYLRRFLDEEYLAS